MLHQAGTEGIALPDAQFLV